MKNKKLEELIKKYELAFISHGHLAEQAYNLGKEEWKEIEDCDCLQREMTPGEAELAKGLNEFLDEDLPPLPEKFKGMYSEHGQIFSGQEVTINALIDYLKAREEH